MACDGILDDTRAGSLELQHMGTRTGSRDVPSEPREETSEALIKYPSGTKLVLITIGLVLGIFLAALDQSIIGTMIPSITDQFGSISNIAWYGSAYSITNTAFQCS